MSRILVVEDEQHLADGLRFNLEAESYDAAKADFDRDPFVLEGVFDSVTIKRWHLGINNTKK